MKRPQIVKSIVTDKNWVSTKTIKISLEHINPIEFDFEPGQFISLKVSDKKYRAYSMCTDCSDKRRFSLIIDAKHMGIGSSYIRNLKIGDVVEFIGPSGRMALKHPFADNLYFFSTGTGIAPFISMLHELKNEEYKGKIHFYHGVRMKSEILFREILDEFKHYFHNIEVTVFISQDDVVLPYIKGRITDILPNLKRNNSTHYYICGNPNMVAEVKNNLVKNGISEKNIIYEGFTYAVE